VRDAILGRPAADWDLATDARPDRILALSGLRDVLGVDA